MEGDELGVMRESWVQHKNEAHILLHFLARATATQDTYDALQQSTLRTKRDPTRQAGYYQHDADSLQMKMTSQPQSTHLAAQETTHPYACGQLHRLASLSPSPSPSHRSSAPH